MNNLNKNMEELMKVLKEITLPAFKESYWKEVLENTEVQIWLASGGDEDTLRELFESAWKERGD